MENMQRKKRRLSKKTKKSAREYSEPIPADLLIEIFSRVQAKSIGRFRCLSKLWGSILRRPDFTELFLTRSSSQPRILFTIKVKRKLFLYHSPQPQNPDTNSCVVATHYSTLFPKYVSFDIQKMICGLVFLQGWNMKVPAICNPATRDYKTLPEVPIKEKNIARICFGYDPINKHFKVLCMTASNTHQILTLENGKLFWRTIESEFNCCERNTRIRDDHICISGVLYFVVRLKESSKIACFDIRSEKFSLINIDKDMLKLDYFAYRHTTLVNYKGKFGIHQRKERLEEMDSFYLWVLEDAENHRWSKWNSSPPKWMWNVDNLHSVGMTSTGELVYVNWYRNHRRNCFCLLYCNFERNTFTRVEVQGFEEFKPKKIIMHTFLDYPENLTLFK